MSNIVHYMDPMSRAMRSQRVLEVFGIPHETVKLELRKGEHRNDDYKKIHPYGRVPALKVGDYVVVESGAIQLHLADMFPDKMNTPKPGTPERALLYEWTFFFQTTLEPLVIGVFGDDSKKAEVRPKIRELLEAMATKFKGPWILGAEFSVADVIVQCELMWYRMMGLYPEGLEPYESFMKRAEEKAPSHAPV